jgi:hypothetical protein
MAMTTAVPAPRALVLVLGPEIADDADEEHGWDIAR